MEPPVPRWSEEEGKVVWESAPPKPEPIEPAFVHEAIVSEFDPAATNVAVRVPAGVTTFGDVYPRGTRGSAPTDAPIYKDEFDPLADWRMDSDAADQLLVSLPEGTPRMLRTLLTILLGGLRRGGSEHR